MLNARRGVLLRPRPDDGLQRLSDRQREADLDAMRAQLTDGARAGVGERPGRVPGDGGDER